MTDLFHAVREVFVKSKAVGYPATVSDKNVVITPRRSDENPLSATLIPNLLSVDEFSQL
jgi:hypothetical protein